MKGKYIVLFLFTFALSPAQSQSIPPATITTLKKIDFGFEGIGAAFEPKLFPTVTLNISAGLGGYYNISEANFDYYLNPKKPALYMAINPKLFYNRKKRTTNGKSTDLNSGNYVGVKLKYVSTSFSPKVFSDRVFLYHVHWGMQRAISKKLLWNAYAGGGYGDQVSNIFGTVYPVIGLKFSYAL